MRSETDSGHRPRTSHVFGRFAGRLTAAALLIGLFAAGAREARALPMSQSCGLPESLLLLPDRFTRTKALLGAGKPLRILAIGSSSTRGAGASSPRRTYPARLEAELARRLPLAGSDVVNDGVDGEVAAETLERMKRELASISPDLVVWQVGTNDAMAQVDPAAFRATLRDGIAWLRSQGVDLILMDPQFCPRVAKEPVYSAYVDIIGEVARDMGVPVMRRYAAMRYWANRTRTPQTMLAGDSFHLNDRGYACVAEVLAEGLARLVASR